MLRERFVAHRGVLNLALEKPRQRGIRFPTHPQEEAERVARVVQEKGGGSLSLGATAVGLELSATSSSLVARVASAKHFGYIEEDNEILKTTQLAKKVLRPTSPEAVKQGRREAFLNFHVFKQLFERFYNSNLPERTLLENLLVLEYGVSDVSKGLAYDVFVESGKFAGQIIETPNGLFCGVIEATPGPVAEPPTPTVIQRSLDPKLVELLENIGSLTMAVSLHGKDVEQVQKGIELTVGKILGRTIELARELNLPSTKMSAKIAVERLKSDGVQGTQNLMSYIRDGIREDLGMVEGG